MMQAYPPASRHVRRGSLLSSTPYDRDGFAARGSPMPPIALNAAAGGASAPPMSMPGPFRARRNSTSTSSALSRPSSPSPRKRSAYKQATSTTPGSGSGSPHASGSSTPAQSQAQAQAQAAAAAARHVRLPLKLPDPRITIVSDPWRNFKAHLEGHGMLKEAADLGETTPDYVLSQLPAFLHNETVELLGTLRPLIELGGEVPEHIEVPTQEARSVTHLSAVMDVAAASPSSTPVQRKRGMLLPIHGLVYASSLVSLPCLGPSAIYNDDEEQEEDPSSKTLLPVIKVLVPSPESFGTVHRYLYTRSPAVLLSELLPLRYLSRTWGCVKPDSRGAMEVLSRLPSVTLFTHARLIHETWANAVAVGLPDRAFWAILNRAWDLIIGALACHRAKRVDADLSERARLIRIAQ